MHLKGADSMAVSGLSVWNALFGSKCADSMAVSGLSFEMPWMDHCCPLVHKRFKKTAICNSLKTVVKYNLELVEIGKHNLIAIVLPLAIGSLRTVEASNTMYTEGSTHCCG